MQASAELRKNSTYPIFRNRHEAFSKYDSIIGWSLGLQ